MASPPSSIRTRRPWLAERPVTTSPRRTTADWAPRVGVAYRITDKTVFRAGAGIYYNPNQTNSYTFLNTNPPYTTILTCSYSVGDGIPTLSNPFATGVCPTAATAGTIATDPWHQPTPRMNQWSGSLQTAALERRRTRSAVPRLAFLSPGPQLLQQHAPCSPARARSARAGRIRYLA